MPDKVTLSFNSNRESLHLERLDDGKILVMSGKNEIQPEKMLNFKKCDLYPALFSSLLQGLLLPAYVFGLFFLKKSGKNQGSITLRRCKLLIGRRFKMVTKVITTEKEVKK